MWASEKHTRILSRHLLLFYDAATVGATTPMTAGEEPRHLPGTSAQWCFCYPDCRFSIASICASGANMPVWPTVCVCWQPRAVLLTGYSTLVCLVNHRPSTRPTRVPPIRHRDIIVVVVVADGERPLPTRLANRRDPACPTPCTVHLLTLDPGEGQGLAFKTTRLGGTLVHCDGLAGGWTCDG